MIVVIARLVPEIACPDLVEGKQSVKVATHILFCYNTYTNLANISQKDGLSEMIKKII